MRVSKYSMAEEAECNNTNKMNLTGAQSSAIYFNLHKNSKYRAALFRQLCATPTNPTHHVKRKGPVTPRISANVERRAGSRQKTETNTTYLAVLRDLLKKYATNSSG